MSPNPVIIVLSPREIQEVEQSLRNIWQCDQFWIKYHTAVDAYNLACTFLLEHKEYTHMILVPDDLVFTSEHYDALLKDIQEYPDYKVISGVCNYTVAEPNLLAVSTTALPSKKRKGRKYEWLHKSKADQFSSKHMIRPVEFAGFPAMAIHHSLFEDKVVTFQNDHIYNPGISERYIFNPVTRETNGGCCWDVVFNHQCEDADIPRYVDFSIDVKHLKLPEGSDQHLLVGKREPYTRLIPRFNPLIAIPSPRNIPKTKAALDLIPIDKLWVKYYPEDKAYKIIQDFFMSHKEYTHLVLCADDLMVKKEDFDALAKTLRSDPARYQVFGGVCNNDMVGGNEHTLAVSFRFPPCNPRRHTTSYGYAFVDLRGHNMQRKNPAAREPPPTGVKQVSFNGFPCMFIARPVLERLRLRTDYEFNLQYKLPGSSVDTVFCWEAYQNKIDIYADFDVKMLHLRGWNDPCMKLLVGIEEPYTSFVSADGNSSRVNVVNAPPHAVVPGS